MLKTSLAVPPEEVLLRTREAADILGLAPQTLAVWRHRGDLRLPFIKISERAVRYRASDVAAFVEQHRRA